MLNDPSSSGDSTGSTVAESEALYDGIIASHPANILALNHETYREYLSCNGLDKFE